MNSGSDIDTQPITFQYGTYVGLRYNKINNEILLGNLIKETKPGKISSKLEIKYIFMNVG